MALVMMERETGTDGSGDDGTWTRTDGSGDDGT